MASSSRRAGASASIVGPIVVRLGIEGPELKFELEKVLPDRATQKTQRTEDPALAHYINHYFSKAKVDEPAGEHTMFIRQAFAQIETERKKKYGAVTAVLAVLIAGPALSATSSTGSCSGKKRPRKNSSTPLRPKTLILPISTAPSPIQTARPARRARQVSIERRQEMRRATIDALRRFNIYNPKMTERQRLLLRVARIFGECELDMPPDFEAKVNRYIEQWRTSGRLKQAIQTAQQNGYTAIVARDLLANGLPPQFFYLALQESNFNAYAVGPMTRKGFAKGMWQFIPETAVKYDLHLGPLVDQSRPDPGDDRHDFKKETKAATLYIQDLYSTDAQASGFLVMACYNWGEGQVLPLIRSLPANPHDRNFWKLLTKYRDKIPQETYDYVFSIASAAVIGENPRLFGFDFDNPLANLDADAKPANEKKDWLASEIAAAPVIELVYGTDTSKPITRGHL